VGSWQRRLPSPGAGVCVRRTYSSWAHDKGVPAKVVVLTATYFKAAWDHPKRQGRFHWVIRRRGATPAHPKPRTIVPVLSPRSVEVRARGSADAPMFDDPRWSDVTMARAEREVTRRIHILESGLRSASAAAAQHLHRRRLQAGVRRLCSVRPWSSLWRFHPNQGYRQPEDGRCQRHKCRNESPRKRRSLNEEAHVPSQAE